MDVLIRWDPCPDQVQLEGLERELERTSNLRSLFTTDRDCSAVVKVASRDALEQLVGRLDPSPQEIQTGGAVGTSSAMAAQHAGKRPPTLGDPFAMALVQWPAVYGLFELPMEAWAHALRVLLGLWVLGTVRSGFRYSHGALHGYGVGLMLNAVWALVVWRFWFEWPAWIALALGALGLIAQLKMLAEARVERTRADLRAA